MDAAGVAGSRPASDAQRRCLLWALAASMTPVRYTTYVLVSPRASIQGKRRRKVGQRTTRMGRPTWLRRRMPRRCTRRMDVLGRLTGVGGHLPRRWASAGVGFGRRMGGEAAAEWPGAPLTRAAVRWTRVLPFCPESARVGYALRCRCC
jgi:hypothetical protein